MNALIYAPSGGGKTVCSTLVTAPKRGKNLLLCSDNSHIVLNNEAFKRPNLTVEVISHWLSRSATGEPQKYFTQQFEDAVNTQQYDTIIVDNISDIFDMAILEFDEHGKIKDPRQYYQIVYQELKRLARKAAQVDCNVLFTAWTDLQNIPAITGEFVMRTQPKLPNKILDNFLGLTQIVGYVTTANDSHGNRRWYYHLEGAPSMYAKDQAFNRKHCLPENIFTAPEVTK